MPPRLLQNFNGGRALIVTALPGSEGALASTLTKLGVAPEYPPLIDGKAMIDTSDLVPDRDILFIDGDLEGAVDLPVDPETRLPPIPVIGMVGVEAPSRLKALVNLGASSFLRKPVHGAAVYTSLFMGINQFLLRSSMSEHINDLEARRRARRIVIKATLRVMRETGLDDDQAYSRLRRESMRSRMSLEQFCEAFLSSEPQADVTPDGTISQIKSSRQPKAL